jgi:hypothetical protein
MRLQAYHAVGHVNPEILEPAGEADIRPLIESRLQLDHYGNLFAVARRVTQVANYPRVSGGTVKRHFDRSDLRIATRLAQQALD